MRVIIIDGGYLMHKGIFQGQNMTSYMTPDLLYLRMVVGNLRCVKFNYKTDMVIIAHDGNNNWRKELCPEYKGDRVKTEWMTKWYGIFKELIPQWNSLLPFHFITIDKIEADDIAAVSSRYFCKAEIDLVTKDRDWHQLMHYNNVRVYNPNEKKWEDKIDGSLVLDDKIENGDKSDHILGKPKSEEERQMRKTIMSLLDLPEWVETRIKLELGSLPNKDRQVEIDKIKYPSVRKQFYKLFCRENPEDKEDLGGIVLW